MQKYLVKMLTYIVPIFLFALNTIASPLYYPSIIDKSSKVNTDSDPLLALASDDVSMVQSNNYDTILIAGDDNFQPKETWEYQTFDNFYDPKTEDGSDFNMDESKFLPKNTALRAPQPLSKKEREIRQYVEVADPRWEKQKMLKLKKGSAKPRGPDAYPWEQFDYDLYSVNPSNHKRS